MADVIVFAVLVGCAVLYRRDPTTHKRLMLLATLAILDAATGRWPLHIIQSGAWPYAYIVILDVIILAVVAYDTVVRSSSPARTPTACRSSSARTCCAK